MVPTLPWIAVRAVEINSPMLFVAEALTAPENNVLYSNFECCARGARGDLGSRVHGRQRSISSRKKSYRVLTIALFAVTGIGVAGLFRTHGRWSRIRSADRRASLAFCGLQSDICIRAVWLVLRHGVRDSRLDCGRSARPAVDGRSVPGSWLCYAASS